jgi:hypothetical protein
LRFGIWPATGGGQHLKARLPAAPVLPVVGSLPPVLLEFGGLLVLTCGGLILLGRLTMRLRPVMPTVLVEHVGHMCVQLGCLGMPLGCPLVRPLSMFVSLLCVHLRLDGVCRCRPAGRPVNELLAALAQLLDPLGDLLTSAPQRRAQILAARITALTRVCRLIHGQQPTLRLRQRTTTVGRAADTINNTSTPPRKPLR